MTPFLLLSTELLEAISLALLCPPSLASKDKSRPSAGLRDIAALAATSRACHAVANPLLYSSAIALDLVASQLRHRQETMLSCRPIRLRTVAKAYRDPWLSVSADDQPPYDREPLLLWAITSGRLDLLQRLLQHVPESLVSFILGARLAVRWPCPCQKQEPHPAAKAVPECYFATPLHSAARAGQDELAEYILRRGVNVDIDAEAQLICMCPSPHSHLLQSNGPLDEVGVTPLHLALVHSNNSTAKLLIPRGAVWDRTFEFSAGVTGLHIMAANGNTDLLGWISNLPDAVLNKNGPLHDWPDHYGFSSLHYACLLPSAVEEAASSQQPCTGAQRVADALNRLGAVVETRDQRKAEERLATERKRLGNSL
ncbi:serine/threonine-protein phosphatase 6 regulatory ankyrin repeat subunit C [Colletotrichum liriopes]|uniref:Serine/threonine-protein phosphatase 6 regulatory ankyrin repeat subunit C n=1 Tax=Colletotrichum liriopes TaxID=708192 RepID=A0AA37GXZ5_9PEZI|nr:serine/threonine-protein phosphatase 6 regulatory ankyrin repeat subunit C [Colletotrichum liriopes]